MSHVAAFLVGGAFVAAAMWFLGGRDIAKCRRQTEDANRRHLAIIEWFEKLVATKKGKS